MYYIYKVMSRKKEEGRGFAQRIHRYEYLSSFAGIKINGSVDTHKLRYRLWRGRSSERVVTSSLITLRLSKIAKKEYNLFKFYSF